jgi:HD-GYP domain-containing protein (c-di-GMP phosphodiesterase class II)
MHTRTWLFAFGGAFAVLSGSAALFLMLEHSLDRNLPTPAGHFWVVSAVAVFCLVLSVPAALATLRSPDVGSLAVALAFVSVAGFFSVHGLATPGFLVDRLRAQATAPVAASPAAGLYGSLYGGADAGDPAGGAPATPVASAAPSAPAHVSHAYVVGLSARLAMLFGSLFLAAGVVNWPERLSARISRRAGSLTAVWALAMVGYAALAMAYPQFLPEAVVRSAELQNGTLLVVVLAGAFAAFRYAKAYQLSTSAVHGAAALASVLMVEAQLVMQYGETWWASWWIYHFQLLVGFGALVAGVTVEHVRGRGAVSALEQLSLRDALSQIEAGFSDSIRTLAASLEVRDPYTHGHGRRVAALAYYAGRELGFTPRRLRSVVQGALLHDVGKIGVPDSVLLKPAKLEVGEFESIKQHPDAGERLLAISRPGPIELAIIRHHHEWFDGSGYPDGLRGAAIPIEARLVAVADVYDALRSNRAYRTASTRERTEALLRAEAGTHFDPVCVEALLSVVDVFEREFAPETAWQRAVQPVTVSAPAAA